MYMRFYGLLLAFLICLSPLGFGAGSVDFNGTTSVVTSSTLSTSTQTTYVFWFNSDGGGENVSERILTHHDGANAYRWLWWNDSSNLFLETRWTGDDGLWKSNTTPNRNVWNAISVTLDGSDTGNDATFRINFSDSAVTEDRTPGGTIENTSAPMYIGNNPALSRTFSGPIAYFQVFNRILTTAEQDQALQCPYSVRNGLVMAPDQFMDFDNSGNGVTFTHSNTTDVPYGPSYTLCDSGWAGGSVDFNGTTSYVSTDYAVNDAATTIVFWMYSDGGGENTTERIMDLRGPLAWSSATQFQDEASGTGQVQAIQVSQNFDGASDGRWYTPDNSIQENTWYGISVAYDNSSTTNDPTIRINYETQNLDESHTPQGSANPRGLPITFGAQNDGANTFSGQLAYLQYFNCLLTDDEADQALRIPYSVSRCAVVQPDWSMENNTIPGPKVTNSNIARSGNAPPIDGLQSGAK